MFPTANSIIYRNEDGEVLGWEQSYDDAPDVDDFYGRDYDEGPEPDGKEQCIAWGLHAQDGDGVAETPEGDTIFECCYCDGRYTIDDETGDTHLL